MKNISHTRRSLLRASAALPLAWLAAALEPVRALAADWPIGLFKSPSTQEALKRLQATKAEPGKQILLEVPEVSDRTDSVPVRVMSLVPSTEQITILVDQALRPVVAQFNFSGDAVADVTTYVKLPGVSHVRAVVKAGSSIYVVAHEIKLAQEGCAAPLPQADKAQSGKTRPHHAKAGKA